ncbi:MAG: glycosyltransferase, partial [Bacteroidales bacterium]
MYKISAIVCTYQHMDFLPKSLQALTEQSLHAQDYEIIIINNNSVDGTEEYCLNFIDTHLDHHITYYKETNQGLSYARNTGIKLSWGHIVCFIDDDAISDRNLLKEYITFFGSHPLASAAAGRVYPIFETKRPQWMLSFFLDL